MLRRDSPVTTEVRTQLTGLIEATYSVLRSYKDYHGNKEYSGLIIIIIIKNTQ
jgi:hypothetical protein